MKKCIAALNKYCMAALFYSRNITWKKPALFLLLVFIINNAGAQGGITVRGTVLDDKGQGLQNVNVLVRNSNNGVTTDATGRFSIEVPGENSVLVISYTGFKTQEITVGSRRDFQVSMDVLATGLDGVVVVAYGTQRKTSLTASVSTIKGDDIAQQPVANMTNALAGRAAGVITMQGTGEPGFDGSNILIRGISTTGSSLPLIVVDGVPRNFSNLDPNSVASITILKDAAAVAPYGMAGANGVVLITTKRGRAGRSTLAYNGYVGFQNPTKLTEFVNAYEYATMRNVANANAGAPPVYSAYDLQKFQDGSDPDGHPDHNVLKELTNRNSLITSHNLSLSGGTDKVKYYTGLGYLKQAGMWGSAFYNQYNLTANLDVQATNTTKVSLSMNGRVEDRNQSAVKIGRASCRERV